MMMAAS